MELRVYWTKNRRGQRLVSTSVLTNGTYEHSLRDWVEWDGNALNIHITPTFTNPDPGVFNLHRHMPPGGVAQMRILKNR